MTDIIRKQMYYVGFRQALSPVVEITRDPRWGRITETYGEDAALTSAMAAAFVKGIQGDYNNVVGLPVSRLYQELKR